MPPFFVYHITLVFVLRQSVSDLIVVTLLCNKNMLLQRGLGRCIKSTHRDGGPILKDRIPKQRRPASATKTATHLFRRLIPAHMIFALYRHGRARQINRGLVVPRLLATGCTMAGRHLRQVTLNRDLNSAAQPTCAMGHANTGVGKVRIFQANNPRTTAAPATCTSNGAGQTHAAPPTSNKTRTTTPTGCSIQPCKAPASP